jgi:hypothetical protein
MDAAAYLHGMSPTKLHGYQSPDQVLHEWFRKYFRYTGLPEIRRMDTDLRPDWSGIYAYGCRAYPLDRDKTAGRDRRGFKVNPRGHIGYLVRYQASNIYHIWVPTLDQVITTRNVTFNEQLFYKGDNDEELPKDQATVIVDILHDGELVDPGEELDIPQLDEQRASQELPLTTEQQLGGDLITNPSSEDGLPTTEDIGLEDASRMEHEASVPLGIRDDQEQNTGYATPEPTPEPVQRGRDHSYRRISGDQRAVHTPEGAGPPISGGGSPPVESTDSFPNDQPVASDSRPTADNGSALPEQPPRRRGRPPKTAKSAAQDSAPQAESSGTRRSDRTRSASAQPEQQAERTTRRSGRIAGETPTINPNIYAPLRRPRKRANPDTDDQLGGGSSSVNTLIADLRNESAWIDFHETYLPGFQDAWDDRATKTMNSVIMAATFKAHVPEAMAQSAQPHRDDLLDPPQTWKQLQQHPMKSFFLDACKVEIDQLSKSDTWTEIPRPPSPYRPLPLKWVWTYKFDQDGRLIKCKARIVVRGDLQTKDSINSTYAATLAAKSFRAAIAIAAHHDLEIKQYDVVGAFLNAKITAENPVICEMPDGFHNENHCVRLNRALYGLRDSPLLWYEEFSRSLREIGLIASREEPCLFFNQDRKILVLFYVDDILLLFHKDVEKKATDLWAKIMDKYEIQQQGDVEWFLGIRVIRDRERRSIVLVHDTYMEKMYKKFELEDGSFPKTPLPSEELIKNSGEATKQEIKAFQERVGSVLYTAIMLRPDVAFSISKLSHFLTNPSDQHIKAVERVIMYLYRTRWDAIQYGDYNGPDLTIAGDASFADDPETRRSSHGYIAMLYGGPIFWKAARQSTVTTSTTKAELLALEHTTKEAMALKRFFDELALDLGELWTVWCDNQQTIRLVVGKNERITTRLRHVDIQNMWLRQEYAKGLFQVKYLETSIMPADGLTKSLTQQQFDKFKQLLNLQYVKELITKDNKSEKRS